MNLFITYAVRILILLAIMGSWYFGILLLAVPITFWYLISYPAYELIVVGALLDIQFYTGDFAPYYFFFTIILVIIFRTLMPYLGARHLV